MSAAQTYINAACQIGQSEPCGEDATRLIAVMAVADNGWDTQGRPGGVIPLCEFHATTPVAEWSS